MPRAKKVGRRPSDLAAAIRKLPSDKPVVQRSAWYVTQKQHWLGWLEDYDGPGAYGRQGKDRSAEFAYNHIVEPKMLLWLIEAAGARTSLLIAARNAAASEDSLMSKSRAIRRCVPWSLVEQVLWHDQRNSRRVVGGAMAKKTQKVALNVWANPKTGHIHLAFADQFMSTVNNREESERRHKNLYRKFKTLLIQSGKWPEGMP